MIVLNKETRENHVGDDGVIKNIKCPVSSGFSWDIQFIRIFMGYPVHKSSHPFSSLLMRILKVRSAH